MSVGGQKDVKVKAQSGLDRADVMKKLITVLPKLQDAEAYVSVGSPNGNGEALKLYRKVVERLPKKGELGRIGELGSPISRQVK